MPYIVLLTKIIVPIAFICLNMFYVYIFGIPQKKLHIGLNILLVIIIMAINGDSYLPISLLYSIGLLIYAIKQKEPGSLIALFGNTVYVVLVMLFFNHIIFCSQLIGEMFFVFCITLLMSRQINAQNQLHEASKLRSARLETDLLKKNIQPHFLMNTLLSIMSWIEINPKKALKLIQALANEFRMITKISSKKVIPIAEEVKLCQLHLELMGYRMDAQYHLDIEGCTQNDAIPPMIFHTLIENGLTHAFETGENGTFFLICKQENKKICYQLRNNGSLLQTLSQQTESAIEEGMGMKYVKARLEESYPHKWDLSYGLSEGLWEVKISIQL